jgi:hypothetical protein
MTAEHRYISDALYSFSIEYMQLEKETAEFVPRPREDYEGQYLSELARLRKLNPNAPQANLEDLAKSDSDLAHKWQFSERFHSRMMRLFVSIVFMSQALCEALINQILILRFHDEGISDLYPMWERARFMDKWRLAPKSFLRDYHFDQGGQIFQCLEKLVEQRNIYIHYKPMVKIDNMVIAGKTPKPRSFEELMRWMRCFISLPYDLAVVSSILMKDVTYQMFLDRKDIPIEESHAKEIERIFQAQQA